MIVGCSRMRECCPVCDRLVVDSEVKSNLKRHYTSKRCECGASLVIDKSGNRSRVMEVKGDRQ